MGLCQLCYNGHLLKAEFENIEYSRVVRGGDWSVELKELRLASRFLGFPDYGFDNLGFRLILVQR